MKKTLLIIIAVVAACSIPAVMIVKTALQIEARPPRIYTVTAYSQTGVPIGKWEHVTIVNSRGGWCIVMLRNGKQVQINGPHTWVEE